MKREILIDVTDKESLTDYFCPYCNKGLLKLDKKKFIYEEYQKSIQERTYDSWEFGIFSCSGVFQCNHLYCNEFVSFCGEMYEEEIDTCIGR
ncbi:MAG: hypothetical protein PHV82_16520, partial [Victivallaceae bacterium]|nr:hypothetical protein [Victivallaceae bacterium]